MENQNQLVEQTPVGLPRELPNAIAALVLGIISIPTCICYGIPGLACGIIAIVLGGKAVKLHKDNPGMYSLSSYNNANAGKVCGIIGVVLSALFLVYIVAMILLWGTLMTSIFSNIPWDQAQY